jgi:tRNA 2-selenouridine synthase
MAVRKIDVDQFMDLAESIPVADVRSPSEFYSGHIPGAINIPLFSDREREVIGIKYKKEGRIPAIIEGLECTAPALSAKLEQALKTSLNGRLLVYCWRGGMRSEAMAWLFSLGDIDADVLNGGYKSYRNHILESLSEKRKMIVLGGMTGSSKTHILRYLSSIGQQVIDLEEIACHKGSAFGSLGQPAQPSTEQFANILFKEWKQLDKSLPFWVEDESRNIGSVFMPDRFYLNMQDTPAIILMMDVKTRLPRLMEEYSTYPAESLITSILKISKRLGGDNTRDAINAVETGDFAKAIEITLSYYDNADTNDIETNALKILDVAGKITW